MKPAAELPRHDIVMGGLAANDAAKGDAAPMASCPTNEAVGKCEAQRQRDLQRARHGEPLIGHVVGFKLVDGAAGELIGDVLVEAGLDDENRARRFAAIG